MTDVPTIVETGEPAESDTGIPYVTMTIGGQLFGLPATEVQDAHVLDNITPMPLAPKAVAGVLNIRGNIVTAVDLSFCLGLAPHDIDGENRSIVVDYGESRYGLLVDDIEDVRTLSPDKIDTAPETLDGRWREASEGVCQLDGELMIVTSVPRLMGLVD